MCFAASISSKCTFTWNEWSDNCFFQSSDYVARNWQHDDAHFIFIFAEALHSEAPVHKSRGCHGSLKRFQGVWPLSLLFLFQGKHHTDMMCGDDSGVSLWRNMVVGKLTDRVHLLIYGIEFYCICYNKIYIFISSFMSVRIKYTTKISLGYWNMGEYMHVMDMQ